MNNRDFGGTARHHEFPSTITRYPAFLFLMLALLAGCNSNPPAQPAPQSGPKPPETLTARSAFQKVFIAARNYAVDVKPFRIQSTPTVEDNGQDGKSAIWTSSFASAMQHGVKPFIWSGSNAPDAPSRGVSPGNEDTYNPSNASTQIFDVAFLKIDSDQALAVAQKHGGEKILEKDSSTPVIYVCDWNHNTNELTWHVIYGNSRDASKLTVAVNASTGEFIRVEK
jgi:hypothetical protein